MSTITVNDLAYRIPAKPRVTLKNLDGDTNFVFDSFSGSNPFNLIYADMDNRVGETGFINVIIEDSQGALDIDLLRNTKVVLELGKSSSEYQYFMTGYLQKFYIRQPRDFYTEYLLSGYGSWIKASHLSLQRRQTFKSRSDPDSLTWKILRNAFRSKQWRPLNDVSIKDITGWIDDGISSEVNIPRRVVNIIYQRFSELCAQLSDETGASIFLDMSAGEPENLTCAYNPTLHTGINVKSGDYFNVLDDGNRTSYVKAPLEIQFDSSQDAGVNTRLHSVTIIDSQQVAAQTENKGSTNTTFKAIAQQVEITADTRHINSIYLTLSKTGDPTSPKDRLNGDIVLDDDNSPTGQVIANFSIPLSSIDDKAEDIFVSDINVKERFLTGGVIKIWIRIFQRSNEEVAGEPDGNGNPNHGTKHTIKWHHNGKFATTQPLYSAQATEGDMKKKDSLSWNPVNTGPNYCFGVFSNIRLLHSRTNPRAVKELGQMEDFIDTSGLEDPADINRFLSLSLQYVSKTRIQIPEFQCSIPNNFLFRPYQYVTFIHPKLTQDLRVLGARYVCSALPGDRAIGALECNLSLGGSYNSLIGNCRCR